MIGIIDYDYTINKRYLVPPSLLALKMSSYLKKYEDQKPILITNFDTLNNYDKIYFFTKNRIEELPSIFFNYNNIEFYDDTNSDVNELVHHMIPDISLYQYDIQLRLNEKRISINKSYEFLTSVYYQAYVEDNFLPIPPISPRKKIYIYDKKFFQHENAEAVINAIAAKKPSTIIFINPIECKTISSFLNLRENYEKISRTNNYILDYYVPLDQFEIYFKKYKLKLLGEITPCSNVSIYLGKNYIDTYYGDTFYIRNLFQNLNLIFSYYSRNIPIQAEIYTERFEKDSPYYNIFKVIRRWTKNKNQLITLRDSFSLKKEKQLLDLLLEKHPIFDNFMDCSKNSLIKNRGVWRIIK